MILYQSDHIYVLFLAVREDAQHISPAKPVASSRISGAWKKVRNQIVLLILYKQNKIEW
jgi:hypothetical protein